MPWLENDPIATRGHHLIGSGHFSEV